jgi:hypothetical protein
MTSGAQITSIFRVDSGFISSSIRAAFGKAPMG